MPKPTFMPGADSTLLHSGHYENFPVASILLPRRLRQPVKAIYRFARGADDVADEGDLIPEQRMAGLAAYRAVLDAIAAGETPAGFADLAQAVRDFNLPLQALHDLLDAFTQDISQTRYADFGAVMGYCRRSANPVGRLILALSGDEDPRHLAWSDGICSALQLINMLQDVAIDWQKGRCYLPQDEMHRAGVTEAQIAEGRVDFLWQQFMRAQTERAHRMLTAGSPLALKIKGRLGLELRLTCLSGERILEKIRAGNGDVFRQRPVLTRRDWLELLWRAVRPKKPARASSCNSGSCH